MTFEEAVLSGDVLPAPEACGLAQAMSAGGIPYVLSFVLRDSGLLLDGTPLHEVVAVIDSHVAPRPLCYWVNCVHPKLFADAMRCQTEKSGVLTERVIGLQANTSALPPEALDDSAKLQTEDPSTFAALMLRLNELFGTRVVGGCCGTGSECPAEHHRIWKR